MGADLDDHVVEDASVVPGPLLRTVSLGVVVRNSFRTVLQTTPLSWSVSAMYSVRSYDKVGPPNGRRTQDRMMTDSRVSVRTVIRSATGEDTPGMNDIAGRAERRGDEGVFGHKTTTHISSASHPRST